MQRVSFAFRRLSVGRRRWLNELNGRGLAIKHNANNYILKSECNDAVLRLNRVRESVDSIGHGYCSVVYESPQGNEFAV